MINVTKAYLPELDDYIQYLQKIWESGWITNNGQMVQELERQLKEWLDVPYLYFVNNGTIALQIALKALDLKGEIITTPFSYVATTSVIVWEGCTPVFADIDEQSLCIDPAAIEAAITPQTRAILATHVYGNACAVEAIEAIARRYNLKVIYDAAHAFGVRYGETSLLNYGDINTLSFHATKLFHTAEGGAVVTQDAALAKIAEYQRRFGHNGPYQFHGLGINGKSSELHAAMGLCVLPKVHDLIVRRRQLCEHYDMHLLKTKLRRPTLAPQVAYNYAYYPIIFSSEELLLKVLHDLQKHEIHPRRYFYPALNTLEYVQYQAMPVAERIASGILCLPLYPSMTTTMIDDICGVILKHLD